MMIDLKCDDICNYVARYAVRDETVDTKSNAKGVFDYPVAVMYWRQAVYIQHEYAVVENLVRLIDG
jgi:hypothetical protein